MSSQFLSIDNAALLKATQKLRLFQEPQMTKVLRAAALAGARVMVKPMQAQAPVKGRGGKTGALGKGTYGNPGDLRRSIRVAYSRDSAGRKGVAYIVGPMGKKAFMRYWVTGGTKPHTIPKRGLATILATPFGPRRVVHHPGARANPFVARIGQQYRAAVSAAMVANIAKSIKKVSPA